MAFKALDHGKLERNVGLLGLLALVTVMIGGLVEKGILVRLTDQRLTTGKDFHVIWPREARLSSEAARVRDWLLAQR